MPVTQITCPHCGLELTTARLLPPGSKVTCPKCTAPFTVNATAIQPVMAVPVQAPVPTVYPTAARADIRATPVFPQVRPANAGPAEAPSRVPLFAAVLGGLLLFVGAGVGLAIWCIASTEAKPEVAEDKPSPPPVVHVEPEPEVPKERPLVVLPAEDQKRVDKALDLGIAYLKKSQNAADGTWPGGRVGCTALPALTLLECGVAKDDPVVARAATYLRNPPIWTNLNMTYDLALAILFLDRLDDPRDKELIRTLAFRLVAGQTTDGGWTYGCRILSPEDQKQLLSVLATNKGHSTQALGQVDSNKLNATGAGALSPVVRSLPVLQQPAAGAALANGGSDNSNTQFAVLALWAARRHNVPLDRSLAWVVKHFRTSQLANGSWGYRYQAGTIFPTQSMTCSGLLGMAVGLGLNQEVGAKDAAMDKDVQRAIKFLSDHVGKPTGKWQGLPGQDLYYLWSIERVAVIYKLPRIEDKEWYPWGAEVLVSTQAPDGSWNYNNQAVGTSLAMLFLKRINLARGLTAKLQLGN